MAFPGSNNVIGVSTLGSVTGVIGMITVGCVIGVIGIITLGCGVAMRAGIIVVSGSGCVRSSSISCTVGVIVSGGAVGGMGACCWGTVVALLSSCAVWMYAFVRLDP